MVVETSDPTPSIDGPLPPLVTQELGTGMKEFLVVCCGAVFKSWDLLKPGELFVSAVWSVFESVGE